MLLSANNVQVDLVKATMDKLRVSNAVPVNSTTLLVPLNVHLVLKIPITVTKAENQVVYHATKVRPRKKAVPNVKPVGRGHTAMGVSLVPKVNTATAVTLLRSLAESAQPVTTVPTLVKVLVCRVFL